MDAQNANIERFSGFAELYNDNRPKPPEIVVDILLQYLGKALGLVVDLGAGTGLSTFPWCDRAERVIGIEPNDDMRNQAGLNASLKCLTNVSFCKSTAQETELEHDTADIITCSQSFHWMEPHNTLKEIDRILKKGGIFAAYDCDWPPIAGYEVESAYNALLRAAKEELKSIQEEKSTVLQYPKEKHLENIRNSGYFDYSREIVFHNREECSKERLFSIALSQGAVQTILKRKPDSIGEAIEEFRQTVFQCWSRTEMIVCYRMRIGIKGS